MNDYEQFIATSRYARWLPELGRRETWEETVDRYVDNVLVPYNLGSITYSIADAIKNLLYALIAGFTKRNIRKNRFISNGSSIVFQLQDFFCCFLLDFLQSKEGNIINTESQIGCVDSAFNDIN